VFSSFCFRDRDLLEAVINFLRKLLQYSGNKIMLMMMMMMMMMIIIIIIIIITKPFRKYVSNIPRKHEVKELQKTTVLGTAHILRKLLM